MPRRSFSLRSLAGGRPKVAAVLRPVLVLAVIAGIVAPASAARADPSIDSIEAQIEKENNQLELVIEAYNKINEQLKTSQTAADAAMARLQPLTAELDVAAANVGELAATAYKGGDLASMNAVLTAGSPDVLVDRVISLNSIAVATQHEVTRYRDIKTTHSREVDRLAQIVETQKKQRDDLAKKKDQITKDLARLADLRKKAYGRVQQASGGSTTVTPPYVAGKAGVAVRFAFNQLGKPYQWAADGPGSYDCSGLTMAAWKAAGESLPHNAEMQWHALPHIKRSSLRPGDLVFYNSLGHVAIAIGNGKVIHAPHTGDVVKISSVDMMPPYGYARVT